MDFMCDLEPFSKIRSHIYTVDYSKDTPFNTILIEYTHTKINVIEHTHACRNNKS